MHETTENPYAIVKYEGCCMSYKKDHLEFKLNCNKHEALNYISNIFHPENYVVYKESKEYDFSLELTWSNRGRLKTERVFNANIIDDKIIGDIVIYRNSIDNNEKLPMKAKIETIGYILLYIVVAFGIFFGFTFTISDNLLMSITIGALSIILEVGIFSIFSSRRKNHIKNIKDILLPIIM